MTRLLLALTLGFTLSACDFEQVIELDLPPYEPRLVVGGFPTPDSVFTVRVGRSAGVLEPVSFDGDGLLLNDARVSLFDGEGAFLDSLDYVEPDEFAGFGGYYRSRRGLQPIPGEAYTLRAQAPGLPAAEATTRLPELVPFQTRFIEFVEATSGRPRTARLAVSLPDPPGAQIYSLIVEVENRTSGGPSDRIPTVFRSDDPVLRGSFEDLGLAVELEFDPDEVREFNRGLFRDVLFDGETREIVLDAYLFDLDGSGAPDELYVTLASLSDDYVRYQQTLALQDANEDNPFTEPVRLHTNVEGGLGAFAGYTPLSTVVELSEARAAPGQRQPQAVTTPPAMK